MSSRFLSLVLIVSCVGSSPVSQPVYQTNPYTSAQQIAGIGYKPQAPGLIAYQPQILAVRPAARQPVYETERDGLQHYATQQQPQTQQQPIQQVLLATNVDRQVCKDIIWLLIKFFTLFYPILMVQPGFSFIFYALV